MTKRKRIAPSPLLVLAVLGAGFLLSMTPCPARPDAKPGAEPEVDVRALIREAPGEAAAPLDDRVFLYDKLEITLHPDGRVERRRHEVVKILDEYAQDTFCDPRIPWNEKTQDFTVHTLRTFMRDGTVVEQTTGMPPDHNLSPVTPAGLDLCPDYLDNRETVVTFLGIELGCVVDFDYSVTDKAPPPGAWKGVSGVFVMEGNSSARRRIFTLRLPGGARFRLKSLNGAPSFDRSAAGDGGEQVFTWTMSRVPGVRIEADAAPADFLPAVVYDAWIGKEGDRLGWYDDFLGELEEASGPSNTILAAKAAGLVKGIEDPGGKFQKLATFAREAVRPVAYPGLLFGEPARPADRVYATAYASPKDHVVLLWALCRAVRLRSRPVLVSSCNVGGDLDVKGAMTGLRLGVELEDGEYLVDPARPFDEDDAMLLPPEHVFDPNPTGRPPSTFPCRITLDETVEIAGDLTAKGTLAVRHFGPGNPYLKLRAAGDGDPGAFFSRAASLFLPGGETVRTAVAHLSRDLCAYSLDAEAPALKRRANGTYRLSLFKGDALARSVLPAFFERPPASRTCPARLEHPVNILSRIVVKTPESLEAVYVPETREMVNRFGSCAFRWKKAEEGTLTLEYLIDLGRDVVSPADYPALRALLLQAVDDGANLLVFRERNGKEG